MSNPILDFQRKFLKNRKIQNRTAGIIMGIVCIIGILAMLILLIWSIIEDFGGVSFAFLMPLAAFTFGAVMCFRAAKGKVLGVNVYEEMDSAEKTFSLNSDILRNFYNQNSSQDENIGNNFCPYCGLEAKIGHLYCKNCGKQMS